MLELIFGANILGSLIVCILMYRMGNELVYKLACAATIIVIPLALVEYKIYAGNSVTIKLYSLIYSILISLIGIGFGFCTNLFAKLNRLKTSKILSFKLVIYGEIIVTVIQILFNNKFDLIKLDNGLYVYDIHQIGNKYLFEVSFGIILCLRICYVSYKVYKKNVLRTKKELSKQYLILQLVLTTCLTIHLILVLMGFRVPFGISFLFFFEALGILLHYKKEQLNDPRWMKEVLNALEDIFNNHVVLDRNYIIIDINTVCEETLQLKYKNVINTSIFEMLQTNFLTNETKISVVEIKKSLESGNYLKIHDKEQSLFLNLSSEPCFSNSNKKIGYLVTLKDATLAEKNMQLFEATEQLKNQMLINEHFANTISHDIKTPIVEMERTITHAKLENMAQNQLLLENVKYSLHALNRYITQSFDYSLKSNFYNISTQMKSEQLFSQIKTLFNFILTERNIQFTINGEALLQQNKLLLEQVFINLVNNTLKHNRNKTNLLIEINLQNISDKNIITYSDNGVGIHPEKKKSIFESFSSSTLTVESTNIGLPMCKKIIETMNGTITETGVFDKGANFVIELPFLA